MDLDADNINPVSAPSLRRPPVQQDTPLDPERHRIYRKVVGMLIWASLVRPDRQFSAKDHTRHLTSPSEWDWSHLKHTLRYIKGTMHYKLLISPRLPQGHSLPLRYLIPLHVNTYWDYRVTEVHIRHSHISTWSTSCVQQQDTIHSRNIISRSRTLCHRPRHQRQLAHLPVTSRTSTTSAENDLRLREHRDSVQPRQLFQHITIFDHIQITDSHLHRQYISTQSQQQARLQQTVEALKQLYTKQKKKDNKKMYIESKRRDAVHRADLQHKQSQLLLLVSLLHQDRAHQAQHLKHILIK